MTRPGRKVRVVEVETSQASPMAQSLLFGWIGVYMYEGDAPLAERRAAALALDRDLLRDLLGAEELRELIDADVLADLELELQRLVEGRLARDVDEAHDQLRLLGPLTVDELALRCVDGAPVKDWVDQLVRERRAFLGGVAGEERVCAAEDAGRLRDALGVAIPLTTWTAPVAPRLDSAALLLYAILQVVTGAALGFLVLVAVAVLQSIGDMVDLVGGFSELGGSLSHFGGVGLDGVRYLEEGAEVNEVRLRDGALSRRHRPPLGYEIICGHALLAACKSLVLVKKTPPVSRRTMIPGAHGCPERVPAPLLALWGSAAVVDLHGFGEFVGVLDVQRGARGVARGVEGDGLGADLPREEPVVGEFAGAARARERLLHSR